MKTRSVGILLTVAVALSTPASADPPLRMLWDGDEIVVSEIDPESEIMRLMFSRSSNGLVRRNQRLDEILADTDGDGEIRIPLSDPPPRRFLVIAVKLASGRFEVLTGEDSQCSLGRQAA